jgi:hypothetical protein
MKENKSRRKSKKRDETPLLEGLGSKVESEKPRAFQQWFEMVSNELCELRRRQRERELAHWPSLAGAHGKV